MIALLLALACGGEAPEPSGEATSSSSGEATEAAVAPSEAPGEASASAASTPGSLSGPASPLPTPTLPQRVSGTAFPLQPTPEVSAAREVLLNVVRQEATDPNNPWAIAHGLLALGPEMELREGGSAVDHIFREFADEVETNGHPLIAFPPSARAEDGSLIRIEPHTSLVMKALQESEVRLDRRVEVDGNPHQVGELWYHTVLSSYLDFASGDSSWEGTDDMAWGLQAIGGFAEPGLAWRSGRVEVSLDKLTELAAHVLTTESMHLIRAMQAGEGYQRDGQGILAYTCGGSHLLQGVAYLVGRDFGTSVEREKMALQARLLFYRFPRELMIYEQAIEANPNQELIVTVQQLKFVGHWLESAYKMSIMGLFEPTEQQQTAMMEAVGVLVSTVAKLKRLGALDNLEQIRASNEQLYLDIVGDSSHALRGLDLALGVGKVRF